jgi:low affinity Fe/Cu permease
MSKDYSVDKAISKLNEEHLQPEPGLKAWFRRLAQQVSHVLGSAWSFLVAVAIVLVWGLTGPYFHYSDTWQLVINTSTTIVTFLMVFLIQNTQNRDAKAIHLKLDELIRGVKGARNSLVNLETMSDEELEKLQTEFQSICQQAQQRKLRKEQPQASTVRGS